MRSQIDGCKHTKEMVKTQIFQFAGKIQNEEIKSHVTGANGAAAAINKQGAKT